MCARVYFELTSRKVNFIFTIENGNISGFCLPKHASWRKRISYPQFPLQEKLLSLE